MQLCIISVGHVEAILPGGVSGSVFLHDDAFKNGPVGGESAGQASERASPLRAIFCAQGCCRAPVFVSGRDCDEGMKIIVWTDVLARARAHLAFCADGAPSSEGFSLPPC